MTGVEIVFAPLAKTISVAVVLMDKMVNYRRGMITNMYIAISDIT